MIFKDVDELVKQGAKGVANSLRNTLVMLSVFILALSSIFFEVETTFDLIASIFMIVLLCSFVVWGFCRYNFFRKIYRSVQ